MLKLNLLKLISKMFASNKPKMLDAPGSKITNSRQQFVNALNVSFDTAESLLQKNYVMGKNLKQTKLPFGTSVKRSKIEDDCNGIPIAPQQYGKSELFLLPLPHSKEAFSIQRKGSLNRTMDVVTDDSHENNSRDFIRELPANIPNINPILLKNGRSKLALMGRIDFCLKMHKVHPTMDALWDVYGQLKKVVSGKYQGENILLLRNSDGGPILQSIYYDFTLRGFESGCFLRAIGRFVGENRLQTFKLQKLEKENYMQWIQNFNRIHNVASFALLQNRQ
ncbi:uncharacterized protein LOC129244454 isoform X1 [Anastrepha obliqua]|uniref:uncharacterized protein LOC129244454 isoform X1 n=1 Tax=Anastrepha obliqua TaxID=95512 RepID=UPI002409FEBD|nr:uncharacterized protein LOC129244454 isoform X1 [Anastrepha obliqua]